MISPFTPSTIPHPWRQTFAILAVSVWLSLLWAWTLAHPVLWLIRHGGPIHWGGYPS